MPVGGGIARRVRGRRFRKPATRIRPAGRSGRRRRTTSVRHLLKSPRLEAVSASTGAHLGNRRAGKFVGAFVEVVAGVAADPVPRDVVPGQRGVEAPPQLGIFHWLLVSGAPAVALPAVNPFG